MIKRHYLKELEIAETQQRDGRQNNANDVKKIQSWLTLSAMSNPALATATTIDGDYGPATEKAVKNFQLSKGMQSSGIVDLPTFASLSSPLERAFNRHTTGANLNQRIVDFATGHLLNQPFELVIDNQPNSGPWVRSYMDGNEGSDWLWCMGFVQTVLDQAFSSVGSNFTDLLPHTYSCDTIGMWGIRNNALLRSADLRDGSAVANPGDIFLIQKSRFDWIHTGIITSVSENTFETIEGNTNSGGSSNGFAVLKRIRNIITTNIDVLSISLL